jgi:hypothetical protein
MIMATIMMVLIYMYIYMYLSILSTTLPLTPGWSDYMSSMGSPVRTGVGPSVIISSGCFLQYAYDDNGSVRIRGEGLRDIGLGGRKLWRLMMFNQIN